MKMINLIFIASDLSCLSSLILLPNPIWISFPFQPFPGIISANQRLNIEIETGPLYLGEFNPLTF
jgi:hypothetical protein